MGGTNANCETGAFTAPASTCHPDTTTNAPHRERVEGGADEDARHGATEVSQTPLICPEAHLRCLCVAARA